MWKLNSYCSLILGHPTGKDINSASIDCLGFLKWVSGQLEIDISRQYLISKEEF